MKLGIVLYSNDPETVWNAMRVANFARSQQDDVTVFLLAKGVELELLDDANFKVSEQVATFESAGGKMMACSTCLKLRNSVGTKLCPMATMRDLYLLIAGCDKIVTF